MFNQDHFIQACLDARQEGQTALREVMQQSMSKPREILSTLGTPQHAGITTLYRSSSLTIINFVWAPYMSLLPHNHHMFAVIGLYSGREDNLFWRKITHRIEAVGAKSLGVGEVASLGKNIIHSVLNPLNKMTASIHVYGGDFFAPKIARSEWDHETLQERPWNIDKAKMLFSEAEARFNAYSKSASQQTPLKTPI
ncbi:MAG: hypothetical protein Q9N68_07845 [Gammaproteobacteria bacterium]|nr:hypothetical protein [Gammaproteobacteria bacterium]